MKAVLALGFIWLATVVTPTLPAGVPVDHGRIEVLRDRWGIPHVYSDTDAGAMYGLGYATAQERGFQMTYNLRSIQGRLAEMIGDRPHSARRETTVDHDRKMRAFGWGRAAERIAGRLDGSTRLLLEAYSAGVNDSFDAQRTGGTLHPLFERLEVEPEVWTAADCLLSWWQLSRFFATDGTRDLVAWRNREQAPPGGASASTSGPDWEDDATSVVQRADVSDDWVRRVEAFYDSMKAPLNEPAPAAESPKFSHAWVVGGDRSSTGAAVLVSDPQTPVRDPSLLMEFHIAGASFNARGVGVPGSPILLIGFNRHVAWGMTALGADQADLFRLETDPDRPDEYRWDGAWRPMQIRTEILRVKGKPDLALTIRETHLGPVVSEFAFRAAGDPEVALKRVPLAESDGETIEGALAMMRARDAAEFNQALAGWRFPTANCVYGDSGGGIGYSVVGAIPVRSPQAPDPNGAYAMPGSMTAHEWQGYVPYELLPQVRDPSQGLVFSANHRPVASFYPIPLGIGTGAMGDTIRSWRLRELLSRQRRFSPTDVLAVHFDTTNPARRDIVRLGLHLSATQPEHLSPDAREALHVLAPWLQHGASSDLNQPGASLATRISTFFRPGATPLALRHGGGESGLARFLKDAVGRLDADPKTILSGEEREFVDQVLAAAWIASGESSRGPTRSRAAVGSAQASQLNWFDTLDGFGSLDRGFDLPAPKLTCLDGQTIHSQGGQAYTQWVPLHDVDSARSVCPIGHSDRPDSRYRTSTMSLWVDATLHPAPLSRAAVDRITRERVLLIEPRP